MEWEGVGGPPHDQHSSLGGGFPWNPGNGGAQRPAAPGTWGPAVSQDGGGQGGPSSLLALPFAVTDAASMSEGDNTSELKITIAST